MLIQLLDINSKALVGTQPTTETINFNEKIQRVSLFFLVSAAHFPETAMSLQRRFSWAGEDFLKLGGDFSLLDGLGSPTSKCKQLSSASDGEYAPIGALYLICKIESVCICLSSHSIVISSRLFPKFRWVVPWNSGKVYVHFPQCSKVAPLDRLSCNMGVEWKAIRSMIWLWRKKSPQSRKNGRKEGKN